MNNVVTIDSKEMQIRECFGQRVVTFKDIDTVHSRPLGTSRKAFNRNRDKLQEGTDYFMLKYSNSKEKSNVHQTDISNVTVPTRGITVLTESGYLLLVKVFDDDLAWKVQSQLVNSYFRLKEIKEEFNPPIEELPEEPPKVTYQTSSTPVPKNPSWYERNKRRMNWICQVNGKTLSTLYHFILIRLGEEYDLDAANRIYEQERGEFPKYPMDIVNYFPDLAKMADAFLDGIERRLLENYSKKR